MPSDRLALLQEQLSDLRSHLLPEQFAPTGEYDNEEKVAKRTLAYRVLAHAEIESFFEDRVVEAADRARLAWVGQQHVSLVLLSLLAFSGREMPLAPEWLEAPNANKSKTWPIQVDIKERMTPVFSTFRYYVKNDNNGVKEKHLMRILLPIGVAHEKIDPIFLAAINSFGALRGQAAHTSSRSTVQQAIDPSEELKRVESLLPGIESIDDEISMLIAAIPEAPE